MPHQLAPGAGTAPILPWAKSRAGLQLKVQKQSMLESCSVSLLIRSHLDPKYDGHHGGRKSVGGASTTTTDSQKESHGISFLMCYSLHYLHVHISVLCRSVPILNSWIIGET